MTVCISVFVRNKFDFSAFHRLQSLLGKVFHLQEPLHRKPRLDDCIRPLGIAYRRCVILYFFKVSGLLQHDFYLLPSFKAVLSHQYLRLLVQTSVVIDDVQDRKVVSEADFIVVHIMGRGHFQTACTEAHLHIAVFDDRYLLIYQRNEYLLAFQPMISFILRIDTDSRIGHDSFRTSGRDDDIFVRRVTVPVGNEISQMIELADGVPVDHFLVTYGSKPDRIPIHHADTSVDIAFFVEIHECIDDSLAQVRVHGEFRPVPVA